MASSNLNKNNPMQPLLLINASPSTPLTTENMASVWYHEQSIQRRYGEAVSLEMLALLRAHHRPPGTDVVSSSLPLTHGLSICCSSKEALSPTLTPSYQFCIEKIHIIVKVNILPK